MDLFIGIQTLHYPSHPPKVRASVKHPNRHKNTNEFGLDPYNFDRINHELLPHTQVSRSKKTDCSRTYDYYVYSISIVPFNVPTTKSPLQSIQQQQQKNTDTNTIFPILVDTHHTSYSHQLPTVLAIVLCKQIGFCN